jgi:hypothetical protein
VFTYSKARELVLEVCERYEAAIAPAFNSYCGWCANGGECPVLINRAEQALALIEKPRFDFQAVLTSPQRLGAFLTACHGVELYQQQASDCAKQYLQQKVEVPGWSLVTRSPGKYVEAPAVRPLVDRLGAARVLEEYGHLSVVKYQKLCAEAGLSLDSAAVKQGAGAMYLRAAPESTEKGGE